LINDKITYEKTPLPSLEKSGIQCHRSPTPLFAAISSHCLATLPGKMSAFKSHLQQNGWYRHLKWTFEDLLPCYYYTIKTNCETIRSQVWQLAPAGGCVASPKIWGAKNLVGAKMFGFRRITLFCLWYHLSKQKWLYVLNIFGGYDPLGPRWLRLCLQTKERTWVNCKLSTAWHQNSEHDSCAVWVSYWQKNCYCKK